ncbi:MAG: helix-turn-helix transcriptional regulator [Firmicutes bacterium]|nr:helix-turn-helix transcriptional regulator [Bacillota bacterium]
MTITYERIGTRLKEARERAGLTQEQAARAAGLVREQLSYYENGRREIDLVSLEKLANLYGYAISYFLEEERPQAGDELALAFRAGEIAEEDLETMAWVQRFIRNLAELDHLLAGESER